MFYQVLFILYFLWLAEVVMIFFFPSLFIYFLFHHVAEAVETEKKQLEF